MTDHSQPAPPETVSIIDSETQPELPRIWVNGNLITFKVANGTIVPDEPIPKDSQVVILHEVNFEDEQ